MQQKKGSMHTSLNFRLYCCHWNKMYSSNLHDFVCNGNFIQNSKEFCQLRRNSTGQNPRVPCSLDKSTNALKASHRYNPYGRHACRAGIGRDHHSLVQSCKWDICNVEHNYSASGEVRTKASRNASDICIYSTANFSVHFVFVNGKVMEKVD